MDVETRNDLAVKIAMLEAKHEAAAEIGSLHLERQQLRDYIARMEEAWEQWQHPAEEPRCATHLSGEQEV